MGLIEAVILGLIQGLTEFLPVSSSGHLYLAAPIFRWEDIGSGFTAVIQLGTLIASLIYFWPDIVRTFKGWMDGFKSREDRGPEWRLAWGIVFGTIPIAVAGLLLEKQIDTSFRHPAIIAGTLIGFGLLMGIADALGKRERGEEKLRIWDGVLLGLWQCLALVPGSSRSGSTITGGLFAGLNREAAARISFLLSIPAIGLSGIYKLIKERDVLLEYGIVPTVVATLVAFVTGWLAIAFLMNFLKRHSTWPFVIYRVALGLVILIAWATSAVQFPGLP